jgi:putative oxidoreductase
VNTSFPNLYRAYARILDHGQDVVLLIIRLTWGFLFAQAGWGKWHDIPKVIGFFTSIQIPLPALNAYVVATTELVGGVFLMLGLLSRLTPIPLIISMIVAYITTEQDALHALAGGNPDPFFAAAPFLFLCASVLVLVFGPGYLSLDRLIFGKISGSEK